MVHWHFLTHSLIDCLCMSRQRCCCRDNTPNMLIQPVWDSGIKPLLAGFWRVAWCILHCLRSVWWQCPAIAGCSCGCLKCFVSCFWWFSEVSLLALEWGASRWPRSAWTRGGDTNHRLDEKSPQLSLLKAFLLKTEVSVGILPAMITLDLLQNFSQVLRCLASIALHYFATWKSNWKCRWIGVRRLGLRPCFFILFLALWTTYHVTRGVLGRKTGAFEDCGEAIPGPLPDIHAPFFSFFLFSLWCPGIAEMEHEKWRILGQALCLPHDWRLPLDILDHSDAAFVLRPAQRVQISSGLLGALASCTYCT